MTPYLLINISYLGFDGVMPGRAIPVDFLDAFLLRSFSASTALLICLM
jgi:hypothetical protein